MSCIIAHSLSKSYGDTGAVRGVDLDVRPGQVFGFLGPNGAGKSTTIKLLTTLIPPTSGTLSVLGMDAAREPLAIRSRIGVVLQQPSYEPTLSVEKSFEKYGMMWNVPKPERKARMERLLADFDLGDIRKKRNEDLSIGQRRRVQVAREFMHDMDLLFLDEPTVGLDPNARRNLLDYLRARVATGLTIFYTTHILSEAEYLCDMVAIISKGRIITVDTPDALKSRFGSQKTINIHTDGDPAAMAPLLSGIRGCTVEEGGIKIQSEDAESVLLGVLQILNERSITIQDISAVPTNLEDIFLRMVGGNAPDN